MEKRMWNRPVTEVQGFEANEYVAGCAEQRKYYFECNAGEKGHNYPLYLESNRKEGLQRAGEAWIPDWYCGDYHPCKKRHEVNLNDVKPGYIVVNGEAKDVLVWNNAHATTELQIEKWTPAKS